MIPLLLSALICALAVALWIPPTAGHRVERILGRESALKSWSTVVRSIARTGHAFVRRMGAQGRRHREGERERVVEMLHALSCEVAAGQPPHRALERVLTPLNPGESCVAPHTLAAVRYGGDIAAALRSDSARAPLLLGVSVCWEVSTRSGAGLADALTRLSATARVVADAQSEIEAQLAGPRASARMMALLPLMGVALGIVLGADPLSWLLTTWAGGLCAFTGGLLTTVGVFWTRRIARRAERALW